MSLLGSIGGALKGAVGGFLGSGGNVAAAGLGAVAGAQGASANKARGRGKGLQLAAQRGVSVSSMPRSLVGLPSSNVYSASPTVATGGYAGGGATGSWASPYLMGTNAQGQTVRLKKDGRPYKRYRSMNPMNVRAARRAIRRIKGARKLLQQIERQLPKQRVHNRPLRARAGSH